MINQTNKTLEELILNHYKIPYENTGLRNFEQTCFICGLPMEDITEEDYIPKWLMREFDLFQNKITLPNKTKYPFKNCKIPCCQECNNETLSKIEVRTKEILQKDIRTINEDDEDILFKWFMKMFIGFWFQSTKIKADIRLRDSPALLPIESLEEASQISGLLKTIKYPVNFRNFKPFSIFKFKYKDTIGTPILFQNDLRFPTLLFAYKKSAFIIAFNDNGIIRDNFMSLAKTGSAELEYPELLLKFCEIVTAQELTRKIYSYLIIHNSIPNINRVVVPENKGKSPVLPWDLSILKRNIDEAFDENIFNLTFNSEKGILNFSYKE
ncbi:MAG: hypothetical protein R3E32_23095 [Chitinophagales bacterium]